MSGRKSYVTKKVASSKPKVYYGKGAYKPKSYKPRAIRGRGDYSYSGKSYGSALGSALGDGAEMLVRKIVGGSLTGLGDYAPMPFNVSKNSIIKPSNDPPDVINMNKNGDVVIRHREYLGDLLSSSTSGAFNVQYFSINPGLSQTFPWLCGIAQNFGQYTLNGMIVEFKSTSSDFNASGQTLGTVVIATDYDSANPTNFFNKVQMENFAYSQSCRASSSAIHGIECARKETPVEDLYIRTGAPFNNPSVTISGADLRLYDWGRIAVATQGITGTNVNLGELWISYEVILRKPKLPDMSSIQLSGYWQNVSTFTTSTPCGVLSSMVKNVNNDLAAWIMYSGGDAIVSLGPSQLGPCVMQVTLTWVQSAASVQQYPTITAAADNVVNTNIAPWYGVQSMTAPATGETATRMVYTFWLQYKQNSNGNLPGFIIHANAMSAFTTTFEMFITTVDADVNNLAGNTPAGFVPAPVNAQLTPIDEDCETAEEKMRLTSPNSVDELREALAIVKARRAAHL